MHARKGFAALQKIINKRRLKKRRTDYNFCDRHGKTLLHYAAQLGDVAKIASLLDQDADMDLLTLPKPKKSAFELALEAGQLEAAKFLYDSGAKCYSVKLASVHDPACRDWLAEKIREELKQEISAKNTLNISSKNKSYRFIEPLMRPNLNWDAYLQRCAETNSVDIFKAYVKAQREDDNDLQKLLVINPDRFKSFSDSLLTLASANGSIDFLKTLIKIYPDALQREKAFRETALHAAAKYNQLETIKYLLARGEDIDLPSYRKLTPLQSAIIHKHTDTVALLLKKGASLGHVDVHGRSELHQACIAGHADILDQLLQRPESKELINEIDIYGKTALDYAIMYGYDDVIISLTSRQQLKEIQKSAAYKHPQEPINQENLLLNISYFLQINNRETTDIFKYAGHCNGFEFLFKIYSNRYFFSTLQLIADWDGTESALDKEFGDIPQAKYYKNLRELLDQWIGDIIWFQHTGASRKWEVNISGLGQHDRRRQLELVSHDKKLAFKKLANLENKYYTIEQIQEILSIFMRLPRATQLRISGAKHVAGADVKADKNIRYYDPNFLFLTKSIEDSETLFQRIYDFKYIYFDEYINSLSVSGKLEMDFTFGCFARDYSRYKSTVDHKFEQLTLPENKSQADAQRENSPNKFTLAHVAVLSRNTALLRRVIANGFIDINTRDAHGKTPLDLAVQNNDVECAQIIIDELKLDLRNCNEIVAAYKMNNKKIFEYLFSLETVKNTSDLLLEAIKNGHTALVKRIIEAGKVDGKRLKANGDYLLLAINNSCIDIIKVLLKNGADIHLKHANGMSALDLIKSRHSKFQEHFKKYLERDTVVSQSIFNKENLPANPQKTNRTSQRKKFDCGDKYKQR